MEKKDPSSNLAKALEDAAMDNDWVDVFAMHNSSSKDPAIAITGADLSETDNLITCKICQISFSGITPYEQHILGSKHKKKVTKDAMKKKYGPKYLEALKNKEPENKSLEQTEDTAEESDDTVFSCDVCNKICTGILNYKLHINGKQHKKKVNKNNVIEKLKEDSTIDLDDKSNGLEDSVYDTMPQVKPFGQCDICKKKFSGPQALRDHFASGSHQKKLDMQNLTEKLIAKKQPSDADNSVPVNPDSDSFGDGDFFAQCKVCMKNFSGPIPYQQHLISDTHEKKLKKVELTEKMKSLSTNDEEANYFHCKDCDRSFCIPEEFKQHLKSSSHIKRKTKQQKVEDLQSQYPEVEVQQMGAIESNDLLSDIPLPEDGTVLVCSVCHKSFTGPESALAHFTSVKHVKAKKQHLLLLNYRKQQNKQENP